MCSEIDAGTELTRVISLGRVSAIGAALALVGCADIQRAVSLPPVNPESPVATAVANAARRNMATPSFRDVPPVVRDLPTAPAVKVAVVAMIRCRRAFEQVDAAHPQLVYGGPAFAAEQRTQVDENPADAPTPQDTAAAEAYAAKLRTIAAPPPALASGPPPTPAEAAPPPSGVAPGAGAAARGAAPAHVAPVKPPNNIEPAPAAVAQADPRAARTTANLAAVPPAPAPGADPLLVRCQ